ncbi:uncharacterized protein LOC113860627 isoform X1 [Abrus precatorius]|uniref:Uncharacterized protein LOC113860627 isoform X1 n=1 Tax=Abrus precatorius TaxID=3816 RepID=A0A8B8KYA9_ABRPR|nr:uncharacterized protein LOC113860627 isoform X1 [Abrus precatorius]
MEGRKLTGSSAFPSELFESKGSHPSSASGIFESIFSPQPKSLNELLLVIARWNQFRFSVLGRESLRSDVSGKTTSEGWSSKVGLQDYISKGSDVESNSAAHKDMSSMYQEQRVQPCHLSSSIYYGGQDIYSRPQNTQDSGLNSLYKKDGVEDDSGSASRGNWWQESLYY